MKRWVGWMMVAGLGSALTVGCVSRQTEDAQQVGRPYTPLHQKSQTPSTSEAQSGAEAQTGQGGSGGAGMPMPEHWQAHPDTAAAEREAQGPYLLSQPQPVPRVRRPAPLGVGSGTDSARRMAIEQLKSE